MVLLHLTGAGQCQCHLLPCAASLACGDLVRHQISVHGNVGQGIRQAVFLPGVEMDQQHTKQHSTAQQPTTCALYQASCCPCCRVGKLMHTLMLPLKVCFIQAGTTAAAAHLALLSPVHMLDLKACKPVLQQLGFTEQRQDLGCVDPAQQNGCVGVCQCVFVCVHSKPCVHVDVGVQPAASQLFSPMHPRNPTLQVAAAVLQVLHAAGLAPHTHTFAMSPKQPSTTPCSHLYCPIICLTASWLSPLTTTCRAPNNSSAYCKEENGIHAQDRDTYGQLPQRRNS